MINFQDILNDVASQMVVFLAASLLFSVILIFLKKVQKWEKLIYTFT